MIFKILKKNKFSLDKKLVILVKYIYYRNLSRYLFFRRYRKYEKNGFIFKKLDKRDKEIYQSYWKPLSNRFEYKTVRFSFSLSNTFDKRIIPEDVFFTHIELTLNQSKNLYFLQHKSFYTKWYSSSSNLFPKCFLHKIDGVLFDENLIRVESDYALKSIINNLNYPVVIKPNSDTSGGKDVYFPANPYELTEHITKMKNFLIQEKIEQSEILNEVYNNLNSVRVCLYKSIKDNKFYVLNSALRMGKDGSLDNVGDGGISCYINADGYLNNIAIDYFGMKYSEHPNSKKAFGFKLPFYKEMCKNAILACQDIVNGRIVSLDMCLDTENKWRIIEVNLLGNTIRFAQNAGIPFFGDFTDEVIKYCKENHWTYQDQKLF